jgi:hypothetical protein
MEEGNTRQRIRSVGIDKLELATDQLVDIPLLKKLYSLSHKILYNKYFSRWHQFRVADHEYACIDIKINPRFTSYKYRSHYIIINPSRFECLNEFIAFLHSIIPGFDIEEPIIRRIDLVVDINLPLDYFRKHMQVKRKRYFKYIESDSDSIVFGKRPERIVVYDKAKRLGLPDNVCLTRVEKLQTKQKRLITRLTQIPELLHLDPFTNISFSECFVQWKECKSLDDQVKISGFEKMIEEIGFHETRKQLNRSRHFIRDYSKYFGELDGPDLAEIFHQNLESYLEGFDLSKWLKNKDISNGGR